MRTINLCFFALFALTLLATVSPAAAGSKSDDNERVQVDAIKEKYWARGDDSELGVVQNRLYTKVGKVEAGGYFGLIGSDPFLSVQSTGGSLGYHFSEFLGVRVFGWKARVAPSQALLTFEATRGATANTNEPRSFLGGEASASIMYGKLSLLGKKILYYDFHLLGGGGATNTETGTYFTPFFGLGQQIYLSKSVSFVIDYRLMAYHENIVEKVIPTKLGQIVDERTNWTNALTLGVSVLFGGGEQ
ncbi:MAG: hypothetical protein A2428_08480 [Bdellovibrionales bacterium RIFOXYC1_FULL_54_43]|nr:MAG: hypothetical protein A2428_08480 [Bdellovibrionales bacterium RIFOXYC1_FULL_54_43]OFZ80351.1 MAG: hypothetical protein A2603_13285 [Bdellovibrionales bacterium RIFOXYD1_FULL_55_31]